MIMNKEVPLKERIEKLYESGYVNEFNYLESQLQEARYLVAILHKQTEEKDKEIERLSKEVDMWNRKYNEQFNIITELEKYLEKEQIRLARENSNIYEDSLGKTKLVNDDIFNEITRIKDKLRELKEGK